MTSLIFMEPPGCRLANYDWPKKRVAAGHLWLSMVSSGPGTSIKQGQDGTVYETAWTHTVQYKINTDEASTDWELASGSSVGFTYRLNTPLGLQLMIIWIIDSFVD